MNIVEKALKFEQSKGSFKTRDQKIVASKEAKYFILSLNQIYKKEKDMEIMEIMKRLTVIKQQVEKRLY